MKRVRRPNPFTNNIELLQEMLVLRTKGKTLRELGEKYNISYALIRKECDKHQIVAPVNKYGQKSKRGISLPVEKDDYTMRHHITQKEAMQSNSREAVSNRWEYRDETGERINKGRKYLDYVREQYGQQGVNKIKRTRREVL